MIEIVKTKAWPHDCLKILPNILSKRSCKISAIASRYKKPGIKNPTMKFCIASIPHTGVPYLERPNAKGTWWITTNNIQMPLKTSM